MHYKTIPSVLISDNHSLVNSFKFSPLGNNSTRLSKKKRETFAASRNQLHHSVTFYFTVLSEPSQDSSTMKKNISVLICSININIIFIFSYKIICIIINENRSDISQSERFPIRRFYLLSTIRFRSQCWTTWCNTSYRQLPYNL